MRLSGEHKALIDETTALTELQTSAHFGIKEKCVDDLYEEGGVEVVALNEVALEQLRTKLNDVVTIS